MFHHIDAASDSGAVGRQMNIGKKRPGVWVGFLALGE